MVSHALQESVARTGTRSLVDRFLAVRRQSEHLVARLTPEDQVVQAMPDCSPAKWHLTHVTWFFETFLLMPHPPDARQLPRLRPVAAGGRRG